MKYIKKPIEIDAYIPHKEAMPGWFEKALINKDIIERADGGFDISTLEGVMHASVGDYIIKGVHGEFYPCKPDIFNETYERVGDK